MPYHVSEDSRELLLHASLHTLVRACGSRRLFLLTSGVVQWVTVGSLQVVRHVSHGSAADGPALGRILLQTAVEDTGKFQEAVAEALASQLQARCTVVIYAAACGAHGSLCLCACCML